MRLKTLHWRRRTYYSEQTAMALQHVHQSTFNPFQMPVVKEHSFLSRILMQSFHSRDVQLRVRESQVLRVLRLRRSPQLRTDAHGRCTARPRKMPHAGRPRQVREHNQRVPRDGPGRRDARARQGMGTDVLRILDAGRRKVRILWGLQDDVRKHARRGEWSAPSCVVF